MNRYAKKGIILATMAMMLLSGCASNNNEGSSSTPSATNKIPAKEGVAEEKDPFGKLPEQIEVKLAKPVVDNPTYMQEGDTLTSNKYTQWVEDQFGAKLNYVWTAKLEAYEQKLKVSIASDDLPDMFIVRDYSDFLDLVKNDMIEDMSAAYADYGTDYLKSVYSTDNGKALEQLTIDGKLYGLSGLGQIDNSVQVVWLRKDWLEKHALSEPKTIADLRAVVKTFNEQEGTTGLTGYAPVDNSISPLDSYDGIFQANHASPGLWVRGEDGSIQYGSTTPEAKQTLGLLQEMYKEGTLDKEFATSTQDTSKQKVISGKAAGFFGPWWSGWTPLNDALKNDNTAIWRAYLLEDEQGNSFGRQETPTGPIVVVKKGFKYPELAVKILNFQIERDRDPYRQLVNLPDNNSMPLNIQLWESDLGTQAHKAIERMVKGETVEATPTLSEATLTGLAKMAEAFPKADADMGDAYGETLSRTHGYEPIVDRPNYTRVYSEYYGSTITMAKRWANLKKLENDAYLRIVLGEKPVDYFDEFVKNWKAQGGEQITKEVNEG